MKTDLILMHPPSVYDFREKTIMFGPMSDMVPSTPVFEMYPIGFLTIANYLEKRGFNVRIINLAYRMIENHKFNVEKFIKKLNPVAFGIDLHWLPHCQGSLEVARILKRLHPKTPVIFGGISATYYYKELIEFPQVDYIVKGDSSEEPLNQLMQTIKENRLEDLKNIPNLTWKQNGAISSNPITNISTDLEEIDFDYRIMFKNVLRYRDIKSITPFSDWFRYPATTVRLARGCRNLCSYCGGSKYASKLFDNRDKPAFRSPEKLVNEIALIQKYINAPVILLGDINHNGQEYVKEFFSYAKKLDPNMQILFEFFVPPSEWFFDEACKVFKNVCYEMSADSHSIDVRKKMGKSYSNEELIDRIEYGLKKGAVRFDLYFMTGMPDQTKESILDTVNFCRDIYERLDWDKRFSPFISPMAPFLDPGSRAFENPESLGYTLKRKTLKDHIEAITQPSWKYILNYESHAVTRDDLVSSTYESALGLNKLKGKAGTISSKVMEENEKRTFKAIEMMTEIDSIMEIEDLNVRQEKFDGLKNRLNGLSMSTVCEKKELEFPMFSKTFNWFQIIKATLSPL